MNVSRSSVDTLMIPFYKVLLPSIGVVGNLPICYKYGKLRYLGIGLPDYCIEMTIAKLIFLLMCFSTDDMPGRYMYQCNGQLQIDFGIGQSFFSVLFPEYDSHLKKGYLQCLWKLISDLPINLNYRMTNIIPL